MFGKPGSKIRLAALVCLAAMATAAFAAEPNVLWQIGKVDHKTNEFALARTGYASYSNDPLFVVGRSDPRRDWPYCHPGPNDVWAGPRAHTFRVVFHVDEIPASAAGNVQVRLHFADTHSQSPPRLEIDLNGAGRSIQTVRGKSDASITQGQPGLQSQATVPFPLSCLARGPNKLEIRNVAASWLLYDAVQLLAPEGVKLGTAPAFFRINRAEDTILRRRGAAKETQAVRVEILAAADEPAELVLEGTVDGIGHKTALAQKVAVQPGMQWVDLDIPRLTGWPANVTVALVREGQRISTATTTAHPHRKWTVYLANHSHVDIGYTEVQTKILEDQKRFIMESMDFVEKHPDLPDDAQFCWNAEVLWAVKDFMRQADEATRRRFLRHVRQGTIGLQALYGNELTGLCSPEEMVRLVDYAGRLALAHGLEINTAMITDVPGWSWGTIAALAGAGVKYFDVSPNANARLGSLRRTWEERPFYWEAPGGEGSVLTWMATPGYYRMYGLFRKPQDVNNMLGYLRKLENRADYPYDITHIRACTGDNGAPEFRLSEFVRDWNEKYESPRLVIGRPRDAFVDLENRWGDQIPTHRGELAPYWEDGAGSSADETARTRRAVKSLAAAEKIWSAARSVRDEGEALQAPLGELDRAWQNALLYDEHTWGAHNSITEPDSDFAKRQWKIKGQFGRDAEREADALVDRGLEALAEKVQTGDDATILVFNPCSWERTDVVYFRGESGEPFAIADADGRRVAHQTLPDGRSSFIARDVPPLGYRTFRIVPPEEAGEARLRQALVDPEKALLRSPYFEVELNATSACISRLDAPRRLLRGVRGISSGDFNRYLYNTNGKPEEIAVPENAAIAMARPDSPDGAALEIESKAPGCLSLVQKIEVHGELPWIDITNTVDRGDVRVPESLYFDFPFTGLKRPQIRYQTAWTPVRIEEDLLPGSCLNYFCVQHYVEVRDRRQTVVLAPIDAPMIEVGEVHANTRRHMLPEYGSVKTDPARVLSWVMNNYWFTNYRAHQPGKVSFRYRIYRYDGNDPAKTERFGIEAREPLRATLVPAGRSGPLPADAHSFVQVRPKNVIVTAVTPTRDGATLIRLHEIAGKKANVRLSVEGFEGVATLVDLWQKPAGRPEMEGKTIHLDMAPREIKTVRLK